MCTAVEPRAVSATRLSCPLARALTNAINPIRSRMVLLVPVAFAAVQYIGTWENGQFVRGEWKLKVRRVYALLMDCARRLGLDSALCAH